MGRRRCEKIAMGRRRYDPTPTLRFSKAVRVARVSARLCLLASLLPWGCSGSNGGSTSTALDDGSDPTSGQTEQSVPEGTRIIISALERGRVLAPGDQTTFTVLVEGPSAEPLAGVEVRFLAPDLVPSGTFVQSGTGGQCIYRTVTDADGVASADFVATEEPSLFLISATIENTTLLAAFAVTVWPEPLEPDIAMETALDWIDTTYGVDGDANGMIYGPFLLPSGTTLRAAGKPGDGTLEHVSDRASWYFAVDHNYKADYYHPMTSVMLEAESASPGQCTASLVDSLHQRWPELTLPGGSKAIPLKRPSKLLQGPIQSDAAAQDTSQDSEIAVRAANASDTLYVLCANGPDLDHYVSASAFCEYFEDNFGATTYTSSPPFTATTRKELRTWLADALGEGCTNMYLWLGGHAGDEESGYQKPMIALEDDIDHEEIAQWLAPYADTSGRISIVVDSCFSGKSILCYQGRGLEGDIIVSCRPSKVCYSDYIWGKFFTRLLLWELEYEETSSLRRAARELMIDLYEGYDEFGYSKFWRENRAIATDTRVGEPIHRELVPDSTEWNDDGRQPSRTPDLELFVGETGTLTIDRPQSNQVISKDSTSMQVEFSIDDPAIAQVHAKSRGVTTTADGWEFWISSLHDNKEILIEALQPGTTTYTVFSRARFDPYRGGGTITVLECPPDPPEWHPCLRAFDPCLIGTETRLPIEIVTEYEYLVDSQTPIDKAYRPGVPTINSRGDVLAWGGDGTYGYVFFPLASLRFATEGGLREPELVVSAYEPVLLDGRWWYFDMETWWLGSPSHPRHLSDDGHFAFTSFLVPENIPENLGVSRRHAVLAYGDGRTRLLASVEATDGSFEDSYSDNVRMNETGDIAYAYGSYVIPDDRYQSEISLYDGEACPRVVVSAVDAPVGALHSFDYLKLRQLLADGSIVFEGDDVPYVWEGLWPGDPQPITGPNGEDAHLVKATQTGYILLWVAGGDQDDTADYYVYNKNDRSYRLVVTDRAQPPGFPPDEFDELILGELFLSDRGDVAFSGEIRNSTVPEWTSTALWVEQDGELMIVAQWDFPAHCADDFVYSNLLLEETRVFFAGPSKAYVKMWMYDVDDKQDPRLGLWVLEGGDLSLVLTTNVPVETSDGQERVVTDFAVPIGSSATGYYDFPDTIRTNERGQLAIDIVYERTWEITEQGALEEKQKQGIWMIGE